MTIYAIVNEAGYSDMPETYITESDTVEGAVAAFADYSLDEYSTDEYEVFELTAVGTAHVQTVQKITI